MIEILSLVFLCRRNGSLALQKGLNVVAWVLYTIAGWFVAEIAGLFLGTLLFGNIDPKVLTDRAVFDKSNIYGLMALGLISGFGGYLIVRAILEKKPDPSEKNMGKVDINDLKPPGKN